MKKIIICLLTCLVIMNFTGCKDKLVLYNGNEVHESTMKSIEKVKKKFKEDAEIDCATLLDYENWYYKYFDLVDKSYKVSKDDFATVLGKGMENTLNFREMFFKAMYENYKETIKDKRINELNNMVIDTSGMTEKDDKKNEEDNYTILEAAKIYNDFERWYHDYKEIFDSSQAKYLRKYCMEHIEENNFDIIEVIKGWPKQYWDSLKEIQQLQKEQEELIKQQNELKKQLESIN